MRKGCVSVVLAVSLVLCAAPAHGKTIKSEVSLGGLSAGGGSVSVRGQVHSKRAACLRSRKIAFSVEVSGSTTPLQKDVSSRNGYAGGSAEGNTFPDDAVARLKPKRLSENLTCSGDRTRMSEQRAASGAPRATIPGTIQYYTLAYAGGEIGGSGYIDTSSRCAAKRRIETFPFDDGVSKPARGHDISSRNGYWGTFADSNSQGVGLRLTEKKAGGGDTCGGDVYKYDPDPN